MAFQSLDQFGDLFLIQRLDFLFGSSWQYTGIGRIVADQSVKHRLLKRLVQDTMDVLDGFGSKGLSGFIALLTGIVELLNILGGERFQFDGTQTGLDVILDGGFVG